MYPCARKKHAGNASSTRGDLRTPIIIRSVRARFWLLHGLAALGYHAASLELGKATPPLRDGAPIGRCPSIGRLARYSSYWYVPHRSAFLVRPSRTLNIRAPPVRELGFLSMTTKLLRVVLGSTVTCDVAPAVTSTLVAFLTRFAHPFHTFQEYWAARNWWPTRNNYPEAACPIQKRHSGRKYPTSAAAPE